MLLEHLLDILRNIINLTLRTNTLAFVQLVEILHCFFGFLVISHKSLLNTVDIVIRTTTTLATPQQPLLHHLLTALQVQHKRHSYSFIHLLLPSTQVLDVAGETIYQESSVFHS